MEKRGKILYNVSPNITPEKLLNPCLEPRSYVNKRGFSLDPYRKLDFSSDPDETFDDKPLMGLAKFKQLSESVSLMEEEIAKDLEAVSTPTEKLTTLVRTIKDIVVPDATIYETMRELYYEDDISGSSIVNETV
jgi:hypothetical protein